MVFMLGYCFNYTSCIILISSGEIGSASSNLSLPIPSLQDFLPQPLTSGSHDGNMAQDSLLPLKYNTASHPVCILCNVKIIFSVNESSTTTYIWGKTHLAQNKLHVTELTVLPQLAVVLVESALWVARKLRRQRKHSQSSLLSQPSSKDTCDLIVLEHFTNRPRSPGTCTSPHCAHCCPRFLQRCTWHLVSQQQRGRVSHWASEGGIARGDSTSELNKSLGVRSIFCSFKMCHSRSISKCVQSVFLSGKPTSDNKERIKMERTHL